MNVLFPLNGMVRFGTSHLDQAFFQVAPLVLKCTEQYRSVEMGHKFCTCSMAFNNLH